MYTDNISVDRMAKLDILGMEIKPVRFLAIELVSQNGAVQPFRVGGMYTQLMGT